MTCVNELIYLLDEKVVFVIVGVVWLIAVTEVSAFVRNRSSFTNAILWSHRRNEFKSLSHDVISSSPTHCRGNNGDYSPNIQNIWPFSSSLPDDVASAEFSHINSERYRSLLSGLQFQSFTPQQHQSLLNQQQRPTSLQNYSPQQQEIRCVNFMLKVTTFSQFRIRFQNDRSLLDWTDDTIAVLEKYKKQQLMGIFIKNAELLHRAHGIGDWIKKSEPIIDNISAIPAEVSTKAKIWGKCNGT
uniref:Uncharacterized protein n=1 Tax=Glossina pallidipes TaxID=7398 RepID=A0A1A9ZQ31_GLOPL